MSIVEYYSRQYRWRRWSDVYPYLGDLSGAQVVDLGCGIGDQAIDLSRLGAHVFGVDGNQEAIDHAKTRGIACARFVCCDIKNIMDTELKSDGVWTSFTAAYFPRFDVLIRSIDSVLKPGGWLAITEVDDLFGHEPLHPRWSELIEKYYARSIEEGIYRFQSYIQVCQVLSERGWRINVDRVLEDEELSFVGVASSEVLGSWKTRLSFMMPRFLERFGDEAVGFDSAFLECLASKEHRSRSRVWFILAHKPVLS
ncbi:MAG: class I SAM-dependent methyltransferase [Nitrospinales bacterium]